MPAQDVLNAVGRLVDLMTRLRAPGGCPWDREQTPLTLRPYILEEACEVLDALASGNDAEICEELGDLLLQVVFQAEIAREEGRFTLADVATAIADKLERRHPHVFGDVKVESAQDVLRNWEALKREERGAAASTPLAKLAAVSRSLPALARGEELGRKARRLGLDWPDASGVRAKVTEELDELDQAIASGDRAMMHAELGDLLLTLTSLARHLDLAPELALRDASERFLERAQRFAALTATSGDAPAELAPEAVEALWQQAKAELAAKPSD